MITSKKRRRRGTNDALLTYSLDCGEELRRLLRELILTQIEVKLECLVVNLKAKNPQSGSLIGKNPSVILLTLYLDRFQLLSVFRFFGSKHCMQINDIAIEYEPRQLGLKVDIKNESKRIYEELLESNKHDEVSEIFDGFHEEEFPEKLEKPASIDLQFEESKEGPQLEHQDIKLQIPSEGVLLRGKPLREVEIESIKERPPNSNLTQRQETARSQKREFYTTSNVPNDAAPKKMMLNFVEDSEANFELEFSLTHTELAELVMETESVMTANITMKPFTMTFDPQTMEDITTIVMYSLKYGQQRREAFEAFMKSEGFWTDAKLGFNTKSEDSASEPLQLNFTVNLELPNLNVIFLYLNEPVFLFNLHKTEIKAGLHGPCTELVLRSEDMSFNNVSTCAGRYTSILGRKEGFKGPMLVMAWKSFDADESKYRGYSSHLGIRLENTKVVCLARVLYEMWLYSSQCIFPSFGLASDDSGASSSSAMPALDMKIELLMPNANIIIPRDSLSDTYFVIEAKKLGVWFTGKWGAKYGELIRDGRFGFEKENDDTDYYDPCSSEGELNETMKSRRRSTMNFMRSATERRGNPVPDGLQLILEGAAIKVSPAVDETHLFASFSKHTISIKLLFEDRTFPIHETGQVGYPFKSNI